MQNLNPKAGPLSAMAFEKQLSSLPALMEWVKNLPFGRNTDRGNFRLVFTENHGTCSTKHALVKAIAEENQWKDIELCLGFFMMNASNTREAGIILNKYGLSAIPEAHTYLRVQGIYTDLTSTSTSISETDLVDEMEIEPEDIGMLKEVMHRGFLAQWKEDENISLSAEELWKVREECIAALSRCSLR